MNAIEQYIHDRDEQVRKNMENAELSVAVEKFTEQLVKTNYTKNFTYMGVPILQYPTDLMVLQELIFQILPDVIIETGVAFGGMTLFYASMLSETKNADAMVIGVDIDIRKHTEDLLKHDSLRGLMLTIQGDSTEDDVVAEVKKAIYGSDRVLVSLDSNHTHAHVLKELELYAPLVSVGSYIVVFDTAIEFYGYLDQNQDRPWGKGNNPYTAVQEFLKTEMGQNFVIDKEVEQRALITAAVDGWLRRVK